jgi:hypothetical protein
VWPAKLSLPEAATDAATPARAPTGPPARKPSTAAKEAGVAPVPLWVCATEGEWDVVVLPSIRWSCQPPSLASQHGYAKEVGAAAFAEALHIQDAACHPQLRVEIAQPALSLRTRTVRSKAYAAHRSASRRHRRTLSTAPRSGMVHSQTRGYELCELRQEQLISGAEAPAAPAPRLSQTGPTPHAGTHSRPGL